jgi:CBS domain-containing protein
MKRVDTGIVPVVASEKDRKPVGLLTDRDLCLAVIAIDEEAATSQDPMDVPIEKYMTTRIVSCGPDDELERALQLMKENRVRRLLVVDEQNVVRGIVSIADLLQRSRIPESRIRETLENICEPTGAPGNRRAFHAKTRA